jgi:hypothetical protein
MSDETPLNRRGFAGAVVIGFFVLLIVGVLVSSCVTHVTGKLDPNPVYNWQRERNQNTSMMAWWIGVFGFGIALMFVIGALKDEWQRHESEIDAEKKQREAAAYRARQAELNRQREIAYRRQHEIDEAARARANIAQLERSIVEANERIAKIQREISEAETQDQRNRNTLREIG